MAASFVFGVPIMSSLRVFSLAAASACLLFIHTACLADPALLVMDFGLKDDTLLPNVPAEVARIASFGPHVRHCLRGLGHEVPERASSAEMLAQTANGYLIAHPDLVAAIGREMKVPWVAIGYSNKFSFLISWTRVFLVESATGKIVARAEADLRGPMTDDRMTQRAATNLANQIHDLLAEVERERK